MPRIPNPKVEDQIAREDIWEDDWDNRLSYSYDQTFDHEMSWQWYLDASHRRSQGWKYVVISNNHKNTTVGNWLSENYPDGNYENEGTHFMIEDSQAAMIVVLKFS